MVVYILCDIGVAYPNLLHTHTSTDV